MQSLLPYIEVNPEIAPIASVIWLHGLGASGHDFETIVPLLNLPKTLPIRFIFPNAPMRPVTLNGGYVMRAWFDIKKINLEADVDLEGLQTSEKMVGDLIIHENQQGIPMRRIILAGFSQGGSLALYTGLRYSNRLGGILALSTFLPFVDQFTININNMNQSIPIMMAHGTMDMLIPLALAKQTAYSLENSGYKIDFHTYSMQHRVCEEEINDISKWLQRIQLQQLIP